MSEYLLLIVSAIFVNNIVLVKFLGVCPFFGVSKRVETSLGMAGAVAFVMVIATVVTFLIQKYIEQHNYFKQFNNSSVNTVRVMTYRSVRNEEIMILSSVLRIGKPGSIVDNQASGGISCGINKKGELNDYIVDKYGNKKEITEILNDFKNNIKVYKYNEIIKVAKKIAQKNLYHRILGLDFCVGINDKIYLLEINNKNIEINFLQMNNGPLFREYTDEVIEFCKNMPKSIVLDFWV